jgi:hypothetical protein
MEVSMQTHHTRRRRGATAMAVAGIVLIAATISSADERTHALAALKQARQELSLSKNDAGGHRERAMKRIDDAVAAIGEDGPAPSPDADQGAPDAATPPAGAARGHLRRAVELLQEAKKAVNGASFTDAKHQRAALEAIQRALLQTRRGIAAGQEDDAADE